MRTRGVCYVVREIEKSQEGTTFTPWSNYKCKRRVAPCAMSNGLAVATAVEQAIEQSDALESADVRGFAHEDGETLVEVRATLADANAGGGGATAAAKSQDGGGISDTREPEHALDVSAGGNGEAETGDSEPETDDFECLNDGCSARFEGAKARNGHMATCDAATAKTDDSEPETAENDRFTHIRAKGPCVATAGPSADSGPCGFGAHEAGDPYCPKHRALADKTALQHSQRALDAHDAWAHGRDAELESFIEELKA